MEIRGVKESYLEAPQGQRQGTLLQLGHRRLSGRRVRSPRHGFRFAQQSARSGAKGFARKRSVPRSTIRRRKFRISPAPPQPATNWKSTGPRTTARSTIDHAEYSINGGDWILIDPVTHLSDSSEEEYRLAIDRPSADEQVIAVRVSDEFDNQAVDKIVVK